MEVCTRERVRLLRRPRLANGRGGIADDGGPTVPPPTAGDASGCPTFPARSASPGRPPALECRCPLNRLSARLPDAYVVDEHLGGIAPWSGVAAAGTGNRK